MITFCVVVKHNTSHFNCIASFFLDPWGEKKIYKAHGGWENGENIIQGSQGNVMEPSFIQSSYQSALVDVIR